jgi:hypothetical protein
VDEKLREADFFFEKLASPGEGRDARRFYVSAFASASRSVTLSLQYALNGVEGFSEWWSPRQTNFAASDTARFFADLRVECIHRGTNPAYVFSGELFAIPWYAGDEHAPRVILDSNLVDAAREHVRCLAHLLFEAYRDFGHVIDPHVAWTPEGAKKAGITIEQIEDCVWNGSPHAGLPLEERFRLVRETQPQPRIDDLFVKWLGYDRFRRGRGSPE